MDDYILSVLDVDKVLKTHLGHLDSLWPDSDKFGPQKVHIVELIEGVRLMLHKVARDNLGKSESAYQKAARRITNSPLVLPSLKEPEPVPDAKTDAQVSFEKAREARRNRING